MARFPVNPRLAQTNVIVEPLLYSQRRVSTPVRLLPTDALLLVDAALKPLVVALPLARDVAGRGFIVKKIDASPNTVTLAGSGEDLVEGQKNVVLTTPNQFVELVSDGTSRYWIIRH
jgi:hypothetical protein